MEHIHATDHLAFGQAFTNRFPGNSIIHSHGNLIVAGHIQALGAQAEACHGGVSVIRNPKPVGAPISRLQQLPWIGIGNGTGKDGLTKIQQVKKRPSLGLMHDSTIDAQVVT